ncbi:nucleotidyltransferase family protein [Ignisphaera sp. 4213-co]|uniref:Nucleotidyltransferase family protein n=1 Tax=Ignisphaera cupida TaxID=3050454 RepID=A0ABD4Z827_9CREN|nr:nucleotidyltransferase family protein [Ignisphaera sp. 4213-co]MDK6029083.1 nucleotidyltransferase family protein [Ignisphaera sp. 4213-co]
MKVAILAGGLGKRLRPLTEDRPKILVEICKRPILEWHIYWLSKFGFKDFILLIGHAKEKVIEVIGSGKRYGINVAYVVEDEPLGTGGAIKNAESVLRNEEWFLVINGDIITDLNPMLLVDEVKENNVVAAIALVHMKSPYGIVKIVNSYIKEFVEKPVLEYTINAGVYIMKPQIFDYLPDKGDIETTAFPALAREGKLKGYVYKDVLWKSIDTIKDLEECETLLKQKYPSFCRNN